MKEIKINDVGNTVALKVEAPADDLMKTKENVIRETTNTILAKYDGMRSPEFVTRKEAMERLNVKSPPTMSRWEEKGYLKPHRLGGRNFYRQDELAGAMERFEREKDV